MCTHFFLFYWFFIFIFGWVLDYIMNVPRKWEPEIYLPLGSITVVWHLGEDCLGGIHSWCGYFYILYLLLLTPEENPCESQIKSWEFWLLLLWRSQNIIFLSLSPRACQKLSSALLLSSSLEQSSWWLRRSDYLYFQNSQLLSIQGFPKTTKLNNAMRRTSFLTSMLLVWFFYPP